MMRDRIAAGFVVLAVATSAACMSSRTGPAPEPTLPAQVHAEVVSDAHGVMQESVEDLSLAPPPMDAHAPR